MKSFFFSVTIEIKNTLNLDVAEEVDSKMRKTVIELVSAYTALREFQPRTRKWRSLSIDEENQLFFFPSKQFYCQNKILLLST